MKRDGSVEPPASASGSRRRDPDAEGANQAGPAAAIQAAQLRAVGTAFLRIRPVVVAPVAAINTVLLAASGAPVDQRAALGSGIATALTLFVIERALLRRREVSQRWLAGSLGMTSWVLALGCWCAGGLASPLLPLLAAPTVVGAAAFGRSRTTVGLAALAFAMVGALAAVPPAWPAIAAPWSHAMTACAFGGMLVLVYAGVVGMVDAHARTGRILERMRLSAIEDAASRIRDTEQLGAQVAHELKNPLAGIKALLQLVRGSELSPKAAERLGVALGEVDRMDGIVRDYLAFARPAAKLALAAVDLRALADDVAAVLAARAQVADVALAVTGPPHEVRGDARRLREAVYNLVDNAIAATPAGGTVTIRVEPEQFIVDDTGRGIDPALRAGEPFVTTKPDGTGLGLAIARAAVAQHGGTLAVAARPDGGTRAVVHIPRGTP